MGVISLQKLEQQAPEMVDLFKKTSICLDKVNLRDHRAQVALVLDISGSMSGLYQSGKVQELVKKVLALGLQFDLDGSIDVLPSVTTPTRSAPLPWKITNRVARRCSVVIRWKAAPAMPKRCA